MLALPPRRRGCQSGGISCTMASQVWQRATLGTEEQMSGHVRAGLIFGAIAVVAVAALSFVPCGNILGALILGGLAGFYGVRWSGPNATVGKGVVASIITGLFAAAVTAVMAIVLVNMSINSPEVQQQLQQQLQEQQQQTGQQISPDQLAAIINAAGPIGGICAGIINLLLSLAAGALGAYIAMRNVRNVPPANQGPMSPPPMNPL